MSGIDDFSHPWCQDVLKAQENVEVSTEELRLSAPDNELLRTSSFGESWKDEITVRAWKCLQSKHVAQPHFSPKFLLLLSVAPGFRGQNEILHGGIFGDILTTTATLAAVRAGGATARLVEINLKYRKSMPLPSVVLCRATATKIVGESVWVDSTIEDGKGSQYCEAEIMFVAKKTQSL